MKGKITKKLVDSIKPGEADIYLWDDEIPGFGLKVTPKGRRVYILKYRNAAGQQRKPNIGVHGAITAEEARKLAKTMMAAVVSGADPSQDRQEARKALTVGEFIDVYVRDYAALHKKKSTLATDKIRLEHIRAALGSKKLAAVTHGDVYKFHASFGEQKVSANRCVAILASVLNTAIRWGYMDGPNPATGVKKFPEKSRERYLSPDELERLAKALDFAQEARLLSQSVIAAFRLIVFTGCRKGEILTLRWQDIDFHRQCLLLPDSKTGQKTIYLNAAALEVLDKIERKPGGWVIWSNRTEGGHVVELKTAWRVIKNLAKLENLTIHDLRHSFASVGAALGLGLPIIGKLLGHHQAATTQRYAHLAADPLRAANDAIGLEIARMMKEGSGAAVVDIHAKKETSKEGQGTN